MSSTLALLGVLGSLEPRPTEADAQRSEPVVLESREDGPAEAPRPPFVRAEDGATRRLHLRLDAAALFGIGGQMFLGSDVQIVADTPVWSTAWATGALGGGAAFVYHNGPPALAPWLDPAQVRGASHRVQLLAVGGHVVHLGRRRRSSLGTYLHVGWNRWISDYAVHYPDEGLSGSARLVRDHLLVGGQVRYAYRLSNRLGLNVRAEAPFPTQSSYAITFGSIGVGVTVYMR